MPAAPATPARVDEHAIALREPGRLRAERNDRAGVLVAKRERQLPRNRACRPFHDVQVAVAEAGRFDGDQRFAGTGNGGRDLAEAWLLLPSREADRAHRLRYL